MEDVSCVFGGVEMRFRCPVGVEIIMLLFLCGMGVEFHVSVLFGIITLRFPNLGCWIFGGLGR